jgi:ABC-type multidrug transport system fused ATPase/permease subunit
MVPQEGYLFDSSLADNVRFGRPDVTDAQLLDAFESLGLTDWLESLPDGLDSPVGQRGESLSAGERQLVALVRANIADPDLLVLDEATSAVDPGTEVRASRRLRPLTKYWSSMTAASSSAARTPTWSTPAASTATCTPAGSPSGQVCKN